MYLSGAVNSGNTPVTVLRVDASVYEKLPQRAKQRVFKIKSDEQMLPMYELSLADFNVPPYPEMRVYQQVTREVCRLAQDPSHVELIVKTRPAILDGSYQVIRTSCPQLEE